MFYSCYRAAYKQHGAKLLVAAVRFFNFAMIDILVVTVMGVPLACSSIGFSGRSPIVAALDVVMVGGFGLPEC